MPIPLLLPIFTFKKLKIICILIALNIGSAYAADNAEDYVDDVAWSADDSVDAASGVAASGLYKATTPLQRRADAARALTLPQGVRLRNSTPRGVEQTQEFIDASAKRSQAMQDVSQAELDRTASPLFGHGAIADFEAAATTAAASGVTGFLWRAITGDATGTNVDMHHDLGKNHEELIKEQPREYLEEYDKAVSKRKKGELIKRINENYAATGVTGHLWRNATEETAHTNLDMHYDSGKNREEFISKYPMEYFEEYDNTVNQWQQNALIQKIEDRQERVAKMSASPAGAIVGYLFIPVLLTAALFLLFNFNRKNKPESSAPALDKTQLKPVTGLFQKIKDGFFATKCIEQIKHVMPNAEAEKFCTHNLLYLTTCRDKGMNFDAAVNFTCMVILNNAETMLAPDKTHGLESLVLASKYAVMFVDRWPSAEQSPAFLQALEKYIYYINNNPIVKDLERMGFNFNQLKS